MSASPTLAGNRPSFFKLFLVMLVALPLITHAMATLWSGSIDLAHHYALVTRLSELWILPHTIDPSLGEMNYYPSGSHTMAAVLGKLLGSPLIGMQLLGELSVFVLWAGIAALIAALPKRSAYLSAAVLLCLLLLNRGLSHFFLYGAELVESYFFSQVVAQALAIIVLVCSLYIEKSQAVRLWRYSFLIVSIYIICGVHLLPASELLGFLLASLAADTLMRGWPTHRKAWSLIVADLLLGIVGTIAFVRNPAYAAMKSISANDGGLTIPHLSSMSDLMSFTITVTCISLLLAYAWRRLAVAGLGREYIAVKYVALYGLAVTALCIAQYLALKLGQGSPYAVKKHMFSVTSAFLIELALLPTLLQVFRDKKTLRPTGDQHGVLYNYLLWPILSAVAFQCSIPAGKGTNLATLVALERQLNFVHISQESAMRGMNVYVTGLPNLPPTLPYMFSIGIFHTPRQPAYSLFQAIGEADLDGIVVTLPDAPLAQLAACRTSTLTSAFILMDGKCISAQLTKPHQKIGLRFNDAPSSCKLAGFSSPEEGGRWTDGPTATITCPRPLNNDKPFQTVHLNATAFLGGIKMQRVLISVNNNKAQEFLYDNGHPSNNMEVALPPQAEKDIIIHLSMPNATAPKDVLDSADGRKLGVMVSSIEFK